MKASLIQLEIKETEAHEDLIERVFGLIDGCRGSDIIVLPELWHIGILSYRTIWNFAEEKDGPLMRRISEKAKELGAFIHCGSFVHKEGDKIYNTSLLFDRKGTDVAEYRKIHLFSCYGREADSFTHGTKPVVVDTEFGKLGLAICYDIRFPELFRMMTLGMGAEIFIVPAAWPQPRGEAFKIPNKVRDGEPARHGRNLIGGEAQDTQQGARLSALERVLVDAHLAMGGSVLTLFTNRRDMEDLYARVEPKLARAGLELEIFIVPAAWPQPRGEAFKILNKVRAMENSACLLSCNLIGPYKHLTMVGESGVIDPWGEMLTNILPGEGIIEGEASAETVRQTRREFPVFDDVRLMESVL